MKITNRRHPTHPVVKAFVLPKINFIQINIDIENKTLLDVGCGNGFFTYNFRRRYCDAIGLDNSEQMIRTNPCNKLILGDANQLPFSKNSFDIVFCSNLLHHLDNPEKAIKEMKRVARGYIIVSEPNRNNPFIFLFALFKKDERNILKSTKNYIKKICNLELIKSLTSGLVFPNATPKCLLPILKGFEFNQYFGGHITSIFKKSKW